MQAKWVFTDATPFKDNKFLLYDDKHYQAQADEINKAWNVLEPKLWENFGANAKARWTSSKDQAGNQAEATLLLTTARASRRNTLPW